MHYVQKERITPLNQAAHGKGPVIYWMSRDQRACDNWALLHAQQLAVERQVPLAVVFALSPAFLGATLRQYAFMLRGLADTARSLRELEIPLFVLHGDPVTEITSFVSKQRAGTLVTDFDPLRIKMRWRNHVASELTIAVHEVDAHNIVPCRHISQKQEYGAYTLRPKLLRLLAEFLTDFPPVIRHPFAWPDPPETFEPLSVIARLTVDQSVGEVGLPPGTAAAQSRMISFIENGLEQYGALRNDPCCDGQSGLSPYLHFGQLAPQRAAIAAAGVPKADEFLEELIIRRELSDNFCFHNTAYDQVSGFPAWARKSLDLHRNDPRTHCYSLEQFEAGVTHDPLWNAAQHEMVITGRMHGYLRMYWAKKILEWSPTAEDAMAVAIALNDRYQLDGRDPNGYAGIAWSIGGVHDRAWGERPIFGKIRYMSSAGCRRKFDVVSYIKRIERL